MGIRHLLIDTNIYSFALRGDEDTVTVLRKANEIGISAISIGELLSGFKRGGREAKNREELEQFLDSTRVILYGVDEETAEFYAGIIDNLRRLGTPIPTNDIWIAAIAFQHGLKLYSKDTHFSKVPGLQMI